MFTKIEKGKEYLMIFVEKFKGVHHLPEITNEHLRRDSIMKDFHFLEEIY